MRDLQREELCDTTLPYGLLYGGFITCVEMYPILAASKMHSLCLWMTFSLEITTIYTNIFVLSVSDF